MSTGCALQAARSCHGAVCCITQLAAAGCSVPLGSHASVLISVGVAFDAGTLYTVFVCHTMMV